MEATFDRRLDKEFVDALNREYGKGGWWRRLVDDKDLFVAIRDNKVNVYYHGCSLAEVRMESGAVVGRTHYKYLLRPSLGVDPYVRFEDGRYVWRDDPRELFVESPEDVESLKGAAKAYAGGEKAGVHQIINSNPNVLDVEIGFGLRGNPESDPSAPRVDFATLWITNAGGRVVFYEAKRFANRKELRADQGRTPSVVGQIRKYEQLLEANRAKIAERYECVCRNLTALHGMRERHPDRHEMLLSIAGKPLEIDPQPRLVVFGFDKDQKNGKAWEVHRNKLIEMLGKKMVLLRGNSDGFRTGISPKSMRNQKACGAALSAK